MQKKLILWLRTLGIVLALLTSQMQLALASDAPSDAHNGLYQKPLIDKLVVGGLIVVPSSVAPPFVPTPGATALGAVEDTSAHQIGSEITVLVFYQNSTGSSYGTPENLYNLQAQLTFREAGMGGAIIDSFDVTSQLTWQAATEGILQDNEFAWMIYTYLIPAGFNGNLNVLTQGTVQDTVPNTITDSDDHPVTIQGPGFVVTSFVPVLPLPYTAAPGQQVDFTIQIRNTRQGNIINAITVTSAVSNFSTDCTGIGKWTTSTGNPVTTLAYNETASCLISEVPIPLSASDIYELVGNITVTDTGGLSLEVEAISASIQIAQPKVGVTKTVTQIVRNGSVVQQPARAGDTIYYAIQVQNLGTVNLKDFYIMDSLTGPIFPDPDMVLSDGQTWDAPQVMHIVTVDSQDPLNNTVTVTALGEGTGKTASASAAVSVDIADSALQVDLVVEDQAGNPIDKVSPTPTATVVYRMTLTNTGTAEIASINYATLPFPLATIGTPPPLGITLAGGASRDFTWTYEVTGAESDPIISTVRVRGVDVNNQVISGQAQSTLDIVNPNISIDVHVAEPETGTVLRGDNAVYDITVTNNSAQAICNVFVEQIKRNPDGQISTILPDVPLTGLGVNRQLASGASATATVTYLVTGADRDPLHMIFTVRSDADCAGTGLLEDSTSRIIDISDAQVNAVLDALYTGDFAQVGETVLFTFGAQNVGAITIDSLTAEYCFLHRGVGEPLNCETDSVEFDITRPSIGSFENTSGTFPEAPGYVITTADAEAGRFVVEVTLYGMDDQGNRLSIKAATEVPISTDNLAFTITGPQNAVVGDLLDFGYSITNETGVDLTNVKLYNLLTEDPANPADGLVIGNIDDGATASGTFQYRITSGVPGDVVTVTARVIGDKAGTPVLANASVDVLLIPMINVLKSGPGSVFPGDPVPYEITISNNSTQQNLSLTDFEDIILDQYGVTGYKNPNNYTGWPSTVGVIPPDPNVKITGVFTIPDDPGVADAPNPLVNTFVVRGTREWDKGIVSGAGTFSVALECPFIVGIKPPINKDNDPDDILGEILGWEIYITNNGGVTLDGIEISDSLNWKDVIPSGDISWQGGSAGTLAAGKSAFLPYFEKQITVDLYAGELDVMPEIIHIDYGPTTDRSSCDVDLSYPLTSPIRFTKIPDKTLAFTGETVDYTITMYNKAETDDEPYYGRQFITTVSDTLLPSPIAFDFNGDGTIAANETSGWIEPGQTLTTHVQYVIKDSDPELLVNTVTLEFPIRDPAWADWTFYVWAEAEVATKNPLQVTKTPSVTQNVSPGDVISYEYTISNVSDIYTIKDISLTDDKLGEIIPALTSGTLTLLPGQTYPGPSDDPLIVEYTVLPTDPDPIVNIAEASGLIELADGDHEITNTAKASVDLADPDLTITKWAVADDGGASGDPLPDIIPPDGDGMPEAGVSQTIHYCYQISNENESTSTYVDGIVIEDTGPGMAPGILQTPLQQAIINIDEPSPSRGVGESQRLYGQETVKFCSDAITLTRAMGDPVVNDVTVDGTSSGAVPAPVHAEASLAVDLVGLDILITKLPSQTPAFVGQEITYTIRIENRLIAGDTNFITDITVTDSFLGEIPLNQFDWSLANSGETEGTLGPGGVATFEYPYTIKSTDPDPLENIAEVNGTQTNLDGTPLQDSTRAVVAVTSSQLLVRKTATPPEQQAGGSVTYTISITNIGSIPVANVRAVDTAYGIPTTYSGTQLSDDYLEPYETAFIFYTKDMPTADEVQANRDLDPYINTITVMGDITDSHGNVLPDPVTADATASVDILQPNIRLLKSPAIQAAAAGQTVAYNITIVNKGNETDVLDHLVFTDVTEGESLDLDALCPANCPFTYSDNSPYDPSVGLAGMQTLYGSIEVQVPEGWTQNEFTNVAQITAELQATNEPVIDRASATIDIRAGGIEAEKFASVTSAAVGSSVTYTVRVTNIGSTPITQVTIADQGMPGGYFTIHAGDGYFGTDDTSFDPDETFDYTYQHILTTADADPYVNRVTVTGYTSSGTVLDVARTTVDILTAAISVEKHVCVEDEASLPDPCTTVAMAGDTVWYYLRFSNPSAVEINNIAVADPLAPANTFDSLTALAPGAETWIKYSYVVPVGAADPLENLVRVNGTSTSGIPVVDTATASLNLVTSNLQLIKTSNASNGQAVVGTDVTYTLTVTNLNPVPLSFPINNITIVDPLSPQGTSALCTIATLTDTAQSCSFIHTVTLADGSPLVNTAIATGNQMGTTVTDTASLTIDVVTPGLTVTKTADRNIAHIGDTITYTYEIRNTGTSTINNLNVGESDPAITFASDPWDEYLGPGQTAIRTATHVMSLQDPDPYTNTITVSGTVGTQNVMAQATETVFLSNSNLVVTNTPNMTYATPNTDVIFTYTVTNLGADTLTNFGVSDNYGILVDPAAGGTIEPGASLTYYRTQTAQLPGPVTATVYAQGLDTTSSLITDTASADVPVTEGGLLVTKDADRTVAGPGETITYTVEIMNIGAEALGSFTVDDPTVMLSPPPPTSLPAGQSFIMTGTFIVPAVPNQPDSVFNTVTVTATGVSGTVEDSDSASVAIVENPATAVLALTKEASTQRAQLGDTITYTFRIQNVSTTDPNPVAVTLQDPPGTNLSITIPPLAPGEVATVTSTRTIPTNWVLPIYSNTAAVVAGTGAGAEEADRASASVYVQLLELTKTVDTPAPAGLGATIQYRFGITNLSEGQVDLITLTDDPAITAWSEAVPTSLAGLGTATAVGTLVIPDNFPDPVFENTARILVDGELMDEATASISVSTLSLTKTLATDTPGPVPPGGAVHYVFTVTNSGTETVNNVTLVDPVITAWGAALPTSIPPGDTLANGTGIVPTAFTGTEFTNTAELRINGIAVDTASATIPVSYLELTKVPDSANATRGDEIVYTFTITNHTGAPVAGVELADSLITWDTVHTWTSLPDGDTVVTGRLTIPTDYVNPDPARSRYFDNTAEIRVGAVVVDTAEASVDLTNLPVTINSIRQDSSGDLWNLITIQTGEPAEITFTVQNTGATDVTAFDYTVLVDGDAVSCPIHTPSTMPTTIAAGASLQIRCRYTPPVGAGNNAYADLTAVPLRVEVEGTQDAASVGSFDETTFPLVDLQLGVALTVTPNTALPGNTVVFRITLTNLGASPIGCNTTGGAAASDPCHLGIAASNSILTNLLTALETSIAGTVLAPASATSDDDQAIFTTAAYTVSSTDRTMIFTITASDGGYFSTALKTANQLQFYTIPPQSASATLTVQPPDIEVSVSVDPSPPVYGQTVNYLLTVKNTGPTIIDDLEGSWTINPLASTSANSEIMLVGNPVRRQTQTGIVTLIDPAGSSSYFLQPAGTVVNGQALDQRQFILRKTEDRTSSYIFIITVYGTDENGVAVSDDASITITPTGTGTPTATFLPGTGTLDPNATEPTITKEANVQTAQAGGAIVWTINVRNGGTSQMSNVTIQDVVSQMLQVTSATVDHGTSVVQGQLVTVTTGTLAPGASVTVRVNTVLAPQSGTAPTSVSNSACAARDGGQKVCDVATVNIGPAVNSLPATGIGAPTSGPLGWRFDGLFGIVLVGALMILLSASTSNRRRLLAGLFLLVTVVVVVGATALLLSRDNDEKATKTPVGQGPTSVMELTTPVAPPPVASPEATGEGTPGLLFEFPPTPTPYVMPTPAGVRQLMIPKLAGTEFSAPIQIVELPIVNREWDVSGLGNYVGWLEGTTWMDSHWGNTVLAAHVQLGFHKPGPFWGLGDLEPGDEIIVTEGTIEHKFVVRSIHKVDPDDWTVTAPTDSPTLTLLTCTEWDNAYGVFSQRLVVQAVPVVS